MSEFAEIAGRVSQRAAALDLTLATAESCTAGCLATLLADAPGAGERFHGGFVVYTKQQKIAVLGVPKDLIAKHTAVSRPVVEAMAAGVLSTCPADIAVAITGVAGPEPDEDGNPVGLMHIAVACRDGSIHHRQHDLGQDTRGSLRVRAMKEALALVEQVMAELPSRSQDPPSEIPS